MYQAATGYKDTQVTEIGRAGHREPPRLHRRQFIIGPRPVSTLPGWVSLELCGGHYLSHCRELRISQTADNKGNRWFLLGLAVQTAADRSDPVDEIAKATPENIQQLYASWAGRWLLIGNETIYMDCSGLLGCFYGTRKGESGEEFWVSSSPAILAEVLGVDRKLSYRIEHGFGIDWYVPPRSGIDSINRLLPSQVLNPSSGKVSSRRLVPSLSHTLSCEEALDRLQSYYITVLKRISGTSGRLWLALTGGGDSRTLLAVAKYAGIPVRPYTHHHAHLTHADLTLPPKLAKTVGMDHTFFSGGEYSADREKLFDQHTAGHSMDRDRFYFAHGYFDWCRGGDTILRSHGVEIGRWARDRFPLGEFGSNLPDAEKIIAKYRERGFTYARRDPAGFFPPSLYKALGE